MPLTIGEDEETGDKEEGAHLEDKPPQHPLEAMHASTVGKPGTSHVTALKAEQASIQPTGQSH